MSGSLLLDGVRAYLVRFAEDVAATEVVDKLLQAATNGIPDDAELTQQHIPHLPQELHLTFGALKSGSAPHKLEALDRVRQWADLAPDVFELSLGGERVGNNAPGSRNILVLVLAEVVRTNRGEVRSLATQVLGVLGFRTVPVMDVLEDQLCDPYSTAAERREGVKALGSTLHPRAVWSLIPVLDNEQEEPAVRCAAAGAIATLGPCADVALTALLSALAGGNEELRQPVRNAVLRVDPELTKTVKLLTEPLERRWFMVLFQLAFRWYRKMRGLPSPARFGAEVAALLLERLGTEASRAVPQLLRATGSGSALVRAASIRALASIAPGEKRVLAAVRSLLLDRQPPVRVAAAGCLDQLVTRGLPAKDAGALKELLSECMRSEVDAEVRRALSKAAELLSGGASHAGGNPEAPTIDQMIKNHLIRNVISMVFRGVMVLVRKVVVGV